MKTGHIDKAQEPFSVRNKPFFDIYASRKVNSILAFYVKVQRATMAVFSVGFPYTFFLFLLIFFF